MTSRGTVGSPVELSPGDPVGWMIWQGYTSGGLYRNVGYINVKVDSGAFSGDGPLPGVMRISVVNTSRGGANNDGITLAANSCMGVKNINPIYTLDVGGDGRFSGRLFVSSTIKGTVEGSILADDSSVFINSADGSVTGSKVVSNGYIQFGSYSSTARNALTAANGMVIYNTTANRFQGYQNNAWINLDDGTSA
jgi:hypothetical protein